MPALEAEAPLLHPCTGTSKPAVRRRLRGLIVRAVIKARGNHWRGKCQGAANISKHLEGGNGMAQRRVN